MRVELSAAPDTHIHGGLPSQLNHPEHLQELVIQAVSVNVQLLQPGPVRFEQRLPCVVGEAVRTKIDPTH